MAPHKWGFNGEIVSDSTHKMYYRGQEIKEAYYRGEKIWSASAIIAILLAGLPYKLHYTLNENLDYTDVKILGVYPNGRSEDITAKCTFTPEEGQLINPATILLGIVVIQLPTKTVYTLEETFSYSGITIAAVYADGSVIDITSQCAFTPASGTPVSAKHTQLIGILIIKLPNKTAYIHGETLELDGVSVMAVYSNGRLADITSECEFSPRDGSTV